MKIALTDPQLDLPNPVSREVSSPKLAQLLISILAEEDPEKYRAIATEIHQTASLITNTTKHTIVFILIGLKTSPVSFPLTR